MRLTGTPRRVRRCGECRLCCKVFPLPALNKPEGQWCWLLGPGGCTVHDRGQPEVCKLYACYWLEHEEAPDEARPDRIGLVVTEAGAAAVGGRDIPVLVINLAEPNSDRGPVARGMIEKFTAAGMAALLLHGSDLRIVYDRKLYPGIEPDEIEAAFKRERARDADELERLGAVDADWRNVS
jgi:hypothetical protein